jgi:hypothetical protein
MLMKECTDAGVRVQLSKQIREVGRDDSSGVFTVIAANAEFTAPALIVATGGLSIPKIGATGFGYDVAGQFHIPIEPCRPALVPLTLSGAELKDFADLTGVSAPVIATSGKRSFQEKMLFTHRGLSGPAILQISSYWQRHERGSSEPITIDWAPQQQLLVSALTQRAPRSDRSQGSTARASSRTARRSPPRRGLSAKLYQRRPRRSRAAPALVAVHAQRHGRLREG